MPAELEREPKVKMSQSWEEEKTGKSKQIVYNFDDVILVTFFYFEDFAQRASNEITNILFTTRVGGEVTPKNEHNYCN